MCIVHRLLYHIAHIVHIARSWGEWRFSGLPCKTHIAHIVHIAWTRQKSGGSAGWGPYSTYSTYSMELGESGGSAGWGLHCSVSPNCASLSKASQACGKGAVCALARAARAICMRSVGLLPGLCPQKAPAVSRITGRCTTPSNSPPWRSPCRTRTFASRAQSP